MFDISSKNNNIFDISSIKIQLIEIVRVVVDKKELNIDLVNQLIIKMLVSIICNIFIGLNNKNFYSIKKEK